ncbi:NUDIX hydrolase [Brevibacterium litoralis]|uniref:NUDIX hydrolase n=1 Tax=Brevibacterium litoralis TaxID=3138935 RepID=UPI0032EBB67E
MSVKDAAASAGVTADVLAAGAVCWREGRTGLEILLVHRPRYNDWSWPKGKVDPGETLPETAVREVEEETGYRVHLGLPLPAARYTVGRHLTKHVAYWSAEVPEGTTRHEVADPKEIDRVEWFPVAEARGRLTLFSDREQLEKVEHAYGTGSLRAWPLLVVRHGKAFPRSKWHETESLRPLLALGTRQALALVGLLTSWPIGRVVSSPWKRCVATVRPLAAALGMQMKKNANLSEKAQRNKPEKTARSIEKMLHKGKPTVMCTHRPVLPTVLEVLARHAPDRVADMLPVDDPHLAPGEVLVVHVRPGAVPRVVEIERFRPVDE